MTLPVRNARIQLPQGKLFWREVGVGSVVVFLHGTWATGDQWDVVVQRLQAHYHCLVPDLLGFGESDRSISHYTIGLEVEGLHHFLDALRFQRVCLVGDSLGGWVAASYAIQHPERVSGLVLLSPEGVVSDAIGDRWRGIRWLSGKVPVGFWLVRSLFPLFRVFGWQRWINRVLARRRQCRQFPAACQLLFGRRSAEITAEQLGDRLQDLKCPVLLLQGEDDSPASRALTALYAQATHAKVKLLDGAQPDGVAGAIREFLG